MSQSLRTPITIDIPHAPLPDKAAVSAYVAMIARNPLAATGFLALVVMVLISLLAPVLFPGDPLALSAPPFLWPGENSAYPLGTDALGRNELVLLAYGTRTSLFIGVFATAITTVLGFAIGVPAGYLGGRWDTELTRLTEIFQTVPGLLLLIVLSEIMRPTTFNSAIGIGLVTWPMMARLVRAEFRAARNRDFVLAAYAQGYSTLRIIFSEIMPNILPPLVVAISMATASSIMLEAGLSFLGLGDPNAISWGNMVGTGREFLRSQWYLCALPGGAIMVCVLAFNFIGDGLNDVLNPRARDRT